jgi:hypothetical protein
MGQCNMAAAATVGSNHNSRAPDGEFVANRGFWPGLCTNFTHNSRFASFVLVTRGDYAHQLNVTLPFSLVSYDTALRRITVMPAFWFMYNMYALMRNNWKFLTRDTRVVKEQNIEVDYLAPDTAEEMFDGIEVLGNAIHSAAQANAPNLTATLSAEIFVQNIEAVCSALRDYESSLTVTLSNLENSKTTALVLKPLSGAKAYREMILYYAVRTIVEFIYNSPEYKYSVALCAQKLTPIKKSRWWNCGGQLILDADMSKMIADIKKGSINNWSALHRRYNQLWEKYRIQKVRHALGCLERLFGKRSTLFTKQEWNDIFTQGLAVQEKIAAQTFASRKKDYDNIFNKTVFENDAEMTAVMGDLDKNSFIKIIDKETKDFEIKIKRIISRL